MTNTNDNLSYRAPTSACATLALTLFVAGTAQADSTETRTASATALSAAAGSMTPVLELTVPAGKWVAIAKASAVSWGAGDYVRCMLELDGAQLDGATTTVGEAGGYPAVAMLVNDATFTTAITATLALSCTHDFSTEGIYLDPSATLTLLDGANNAANLGCAGNSPNDIMVRVGPLCVDKYEASVWSSPDGTGTQYPSGAPRYPATFPTNGNWTTPLYAVSKPGVGPSTFITWFQAQQACALSGKRLLTNAEWQMAAAGTPDPGMAGDGKTTCNTNTPGSVKTGSTGNCVSKWGVSDMVGNVAEWVADWTQAGGVSTSGAPIDAWIPGRSSTSTPTYGNDMVSGINEAVHLEAPQTGGVGDDNSVDNLPAAISRGGIWTARGSGGVFMLDAGHTPSSLDNATGFRCAR